MSQVVLPQNQMNQVVLPQNQMRQAIHPLNQINQMVLRRSQEKFKFISIFSSRHVFLCGRSWGRVNWRASWGVISGQSSTLHGVKSQSHSPIVSGWLGVPGIPAIGRRRVDLLLCVQGCCGGA
ncbi:hypothetical protein TNIN_375832 [Trichonephila inaurata madagascariensis]|uniref:Uncharacterized protein n=1 Tax=Trichonephila inaurata madagascariensis TaxID=2747483 RepID=A0A8X6WWS6_9ARAC|nr:hypothetical protein TNIN_375832 [Trichonephila inaurata madagascariensis]